MVNDGVRMSLNLSSQELFVMDENDIEQANTNVPSISELLRDVGQLENKLFELTSKYYYQDDGSFDDLFCRSSSISPPTSLTTDKIIKKKSIDSFIRPKATSRGYRSSLLKQQQQVKSSPTATTTTTSFIYGRKPSDASSSSVSPQKDPFRTPPRNTTSRPPRSAPSPRFGALTRENVSLLQTVPRRITRGTAAGGGGGSVCGSQKSRTSVRTDGGAVFSRLYQSDYHQNRDARLRAMKERQENIKDTSSSRRSSRKNTSSVYGGGDSYRDSESVSSMQSNFSNFSSKTDLAYVSSRLYDPDYMRKRQARLDKMKNEREMKNCTFSPRINPNNSRRQKFAKET